MMFPSRKLTGSHRRVGMTARLRSRRRFKTFVRTNEDAKDGKRCP
jgi:hypothetical protein